MKTDSDVFFGAVTRGRIENRDLARFTSRGALSPREGLENYRRMFLARQIEALAELFPVTRAHLSSAAFQRIASAYVAAHVSVHPALEGVGAAFPEFLARAGDDTASRVAALEWAALWVFLAEDEPPASTETGPEPARMAEATLELSRAIAILPCDPRTRSAWRDAGGPPIAAAEDEAATHVLVRRRQFEVRMRAIDAGEAEALERALRGQPFSAVCEPFTSAPEPIAAAAACVRRWLSTGVARRFRAPQ